MKNNQNHSRIIAIAPSTIGFGFAVMDDGILVNWGVKTAKGDKNAQTLMKIEKLLVHYEPSAMVLEAYEAKGSRRSPRIKRLGRDMTALASSRKIKTVSFSRQQVIKTFFVDGKGTRHAIATILAGRFSEELGALLPPKRRSYDNEDPRMDTFNAVALAIVFRSKMGK